MFRSILISCWFLPNFLGAQFGEVLDPLKHIKPTDVIQWTGVEARQDSSGSWQIGLRVLTKQNFTLYTDKVTFLGPSGFQLSGLKGPATTQIVDPLSGKKVDVYGSGEFFLTFHASRELTSSTFPLAVTYLGCTETICLLPHTVNLDIPAVASAEFDGNFDQQVAKQAVDNDALSKEAQTPLKDFSSDVDSGDLQQELAAKIQSGQLNLSLLLLLLFIGGLATNLTPCVFPMIPITIKLLSRQGLRPLVGSTFYALGIVLSYSTLGIIVALTGGMFGALLASTAFNTVFALAFFLFGLSMLGFGNLSVLQTWGSKLGAGKASPLNTIIMGVGAGLVAAPCTGPILGALITYAAKSENPGQIPLQFFVYSFGFALPYMFLGLAANKITRLQVSAYLQIAIKLVFAGVMFGLAFFYLKVPFYAFLQHLNGYWLLLTTLGISAGILIILGIQVSGFGHSKRAQVLPTIVLGFGIFSGVQYLGGGDIQSTLTWHKDLESGFAAAQEQGKPVLIDGWAEWCVACKQMDSTTFIDSKVVSELSKNWVIVKIDFTEMGDKQEEIGEKWEMQGLPTTVLVNSQGDQSTSRKLVGYVSAKKLLSELLEFKKE